MATKEPTKVKPFTRLEGKEFSPLVLRRYSTPMLYFVGIITDDDLDTLDKNVKDNFDALFSGSTQTIQDMRNLAGGLSSMLADDYPKAEGIAVILVADKCLISSLYGDFMNHEQCKLELYQLLNFATQV